MSQTTLELTSIDTRHDNDEHHDLVPEAPQARYPPADEGKDAWLFLAACFLIEALVWGFPFSYGIFQEYYSSNPPFAGSPNLAVVGTCSMGIMYLSSPLVFAIFKKWPQVRRPSIYLGLFTMCFGLALSSFSTSVSHLIITQGIIYAIGGSLCYFPTILFVNEWFITKRGFAFGIMWAGTGVSGVVSPIAIQWLLSDYGFRTALRTWSLVVFILSAPLLYYLRPRLPDSSTRREHGRGKLFDFTFLKTPEFLVLQACNILEGLGYFMPTIFLPTFSRQILHSSPIAATSTLITVNITSVFGCIIMGALIDRYHVTTCILISSIGATIGTFLIWGFTNNLPLLYVFSAIYGLFAGSYSSTWAGVIRYLQEKDQNADAGMIFAVLAFGRGIGNICSGPLSEALVKGKPWFSEAVRAYGSEYGALITFTGISAGLGGLSFLVRRLGYL